ncbi:MAG: c-type cytochrome [Anaerolineales bacterium]|nr:c-type cytochrome [Anaerolineales bacterium]
MASLIGFQRQQFGGWGVRTVDVMANVAESGGFQPDHIEVSAGETVVVRFHTKDVTHGVALGPGLDVDLGDIAPGEVKAVKLTFDEAGTFTFYCNRWCSPNHWRMRGIIAVSNSHGTTPGAPRDPVIENLIAEGVDIDSAVHEMTRPVDTQPVRPSIVRGAAIRSTFSIPAELTATAWRRTHAPEEGSALLAQANSAISSADLEDIVASFWASAPDGFNARATAGLYAKNCASCHGAQGAGDGLAAGLAQQPPPSFADPNRMVARRNDVLYAKIRRGGMGTGMPNFGTLFTPEETWDLVHLLRSFSTQEGAGERR